MALTFITTSDIIVNASMAFGCCCLSFLSGFLWKSHHDDVDDQPPFTSIHTLLARRSLVSPSLLLLSSATRLVFLSISRDTERALAHLQCSQSSLSRCTHTPKSGHITCIPDFYFITANKSKAGMVISELIKNMVFCIIIIILFMCVCSEGSQPQTSGGHALKLKALVS